MSYAIELTPEAQRTMERVRQLPLIVMRGIARAMDVHFLATVAISKSSVETTTSVKHLDANAASIV